MIPSQVEDRKELEAPLGLGFEWPEKVWAWALPSGLLLSVEIGNAGRCRVGSVSPGGLFTFVRPFLDNQARSLPGILVKDAGPVALLFEEWAGRPAVCPFDALILLDDNGLEIDRRWVR